MADTATREVPPLPQLDQTPRADDPGLQRKISWTGAFWIASGVPALVLTSIGGIAAYVGTPSALVWTVSVLFGLIQSAIFAEIAGMFPHKSGGASVYGAMAWAPYSKFIAPISVWCNWLAWSPVLAICSSIAAGYLLTALFPAESAINTWSLSLIDLGGLKEGLEVRVNATFVIAAALLLLVFFLQHHGILRTAKLQTIIGIAVLVPLLIVGLVPLLTGDVVSANFTPFVPLSGAWDAPGWTLFAGGLFLAAWTAYAFETSICYTREFKDPARDTPRAIFYSGLVCLVVLVLVPFTFQGALGVDRLVQDDIVAGTGVAAAMADMVGGGAFIGTLLVVMLILALLLSVMTTMAGSSRTLYQGSVDGWLPRYLGKANQHGAPARAMWTDLGFNLVLLLLSDTLFVLASSTVCYMIFNFLNLNAGWLHRRDNPDVPRPWKAPTVLIAAGTVLAFVNALLLGWGTSVWGPGTLLTGLVFAALVIPFFIYRHYIQDGGKFPESMYDTMATVAAAPVAAAPASASVSAPAAPAAAATATTDSPAVDVVETKNADVVETEDAGTSAAGTGATTVSTTVDEPVKETDAKATEEADAKVDTAADADAKVTETDAKVADADAKAADSTDAKVADDAKVDPDAKVAGSTDEVVVAGDEVAVADDKADAAADAPAATADAKAADAKADAAKADAAKADAAKADAVDEPAVDKVEAEPVVVPADDSTTASTVPTPTRNSPLLPYLVLAGGALMVIIGQFYLAV